MDNAMISHNMEWEYNDVVFSILSQQFFRKPNFITDRRSSAKIKIKGSREIIETLIANIRKESHFFDKGEEEEFLKHLAAVFNIRSKTIFTEYQERINSLEHVQDPDNKIKMMQALSVVLSYYHKRTRDATHKLLKKDCNFENSKKEFDNALELMYQQADSDLSLLHNISVLMNYAKLIKKEISTKHYEKKKKEVVEKICKMISEMK